MAKDTIKSIKILVRDCHKYLFHNMTKGLFLHFTNSTYKLIFRKIFKYKRDKAYKRKKFKIFAKLRETSSGGENRHFLYKAIGSLNFLNF